MNKANEHLLYIEDISEFDTPRNQGEYYADIVYQQVFRSALITSVNGIEVRPPGFTHIRFAPSIKPHELRRAMLTLAAQLSDRHSEALTLQWAQSFDQQTTGRFHRDAAPDESYLLLGYEASPVKSAVHIADFSRAAHDLGIAPAEYEAQFNPLLAANTERLAPYVTLLAPFASNCSHLLILNNSVSRPGVFHQATVLNLIPGGWRVINSVLLAPLSLAGEKVSPEECEAFVTDNAA